MFQQLFILIVSLGFAWHPDEINGLVRDIDRKDQILTIRSDNSMIQCQISKHAKLYDPSRSQYLPMTELKEGSLIKATRDLDCNCVIEIRLLGR